MLTIPNAVQAVFEESEVAQLAAQAGILNVSAFARIIKPAVEEKTIKSVSVGSITTALSRSLSQNPPEPLKPEVILNSIKIYSPLTSLTYEKNNSVISILFSYEPKNIFSITQGLEQVTIIISDDKTSDLKKRLGTPLGEYRDMGAVSVEFNRDYLAVANTIYTLFSYLSIKHINVMEVVSTLTTVTFLVSREETEMAFEVLHKYLR